MSNQHGNTTEKNNEAKVTQRKTYLVVPFKEKEKAKKMRLSNGEKAISYDEKNKMWYAKAGTDTGLIADWMPDTTKVPEVTEGDPQSEFSQFLDNAGLIINGLPEMDGKKHRVSTVDDKGNKKSAVYVGYLDERPAGWYQDYKNNDEPVKWKATGKALAKEAQQHLKAINLQRSLVRKEQQAKRFIHHAARVSSAYNVMPDVGTSKHYYLQNKGIKAFPGVKLDKKNRIVIPLRNEKNEIRTLQRIDKKGFKLLKKGAEKNGNYFVVGDQPLKDGDPILYAEGYSTSASIAEATGRSVVMTVDAGNMPVVAEKINARYPNSPQIFLADDDHKLENNKGKLKAEQSAKLVGGQSEVPTFTEEEIQKGLTDFNDLHTSRGLDAVKHQVDAIVSEAIKSREENMTPVIEGQTSLPDADQHTIDHSSDTQPTALNAKENTIEENVKNVDSVPTTINPHEGDIMNANDSKDERSNQEKVNDSNKAYAIKAQEAIANNDDLVSVMEESLNELKKIRDDNKPDLSLQSDHNDIENFLDKMNGQKDGIFFGKDYDTSVAPSQYNPDVLIIQNTQWHDEARTKGVAHDITFDTTKNEYTLIQKHEYHLDEPHQNKNAITIEDSGEITRELQSIFSDRGQDINLAPQTSLVDKPLPDAVMHQNEDAPLSQGLLNSISRMNGYKDFKSYQNHIDDIHSNYDKISLLGESNSRQYTLMSKDNHSEKFIYRVNHENKTADLTQHVKDGERKDINAPDLAPASIVESNRQLERAWKFIKGKVTDKKVDIDTVKSATPTAEHMHNNAERTSTLDSLNPDIDVDKISSLSLSEQAKVTYAQAKKDHQNGDIETAEKNVSSAKRLAFDSGRAGEDKGTFDPNVYPDLHQSFVRGTDVFEAKTRLAHHREVEKQQEIAKEAIKEEPVQQSPETTHEKQTLREQPIEEKQKEEAINAKDNVKPSSDSEIENTEDVEALPSGGTVERGDSRSINSTVDHDDSSSVINEKVNSKKKETGKENAQDNAQDDVALSPKAKKILTQINREYRGDKGKYYRKDFKGNEHLAFEDKSSKITTADNDQKVAFSIAAMAEAKGWKEIKVTGHPVFRRNVWLEAKSRGLDVKGYTPSDHDKLALKDRLNAKKRDTPAAKEKGGTVESVLKAAAEAVVKSVVKNPKAQTMIMDHIEKRQQGKQYSVPTYDINAPQKNTPSIDKARQNESSQERTR